MKTLRIAGCMSGTSCDGFDISLLEVKSPEIRTELKLKAHAQYEYPKSLRKRVLSIQKTSELKTTLKEILLLNRDLGIYFSKCVQKFVKHHPVDVVSLHGQTVAHYPGLKPVGVTSQLGDPYFTLQSTDLTTIHQLRAGDLAGGGDGAPLLPNTFQKLIKTMHLENKAVSFQNLGGFANCAVFSKGGKFQIGFDTGIANAWIDLATARFTHGKQSYDREGKIALRGRTDKVTLTKWLKHPYLLKSPPKSTGRDDFTEEMLFENKRLNGENLIRTALEFAVQSTVKSYEKFVFTTYGKPSRIIFYGGGVKNNFLMRRFQEEFGDIKCVSIADYGYSPESVEALGFAWLGFCTLLGKGVGGPWSGSDENMLSVGQVLPGRNWHDILKWFSQSSEKNARRKGHSSR